MTALKITINSKDVKIKEGKEPLVKITRVFE